MKLYNLDNKPAHVFTLPEKLSEISGLAMTNDGRLFCHNDERGIIYQLDYNNGKIVKNFSIGFFTVRNDFEGIAIVNDKFFLVSSAGAIYAFSEGKNNKYVSYEIYKTDLNAKYNVEGLCYDPETNCLLLACKGFAGKDYKKYKAVYAFSLSTMKLIKKPRFLLNEKKLAKNSKEKQFNPSGIERHPLTGTFFIIAASGKSIIELSGEGKILGQKHLKNKWHEQPEGITFTSDNILLISDEGKRGRAKLSIYKPALYHQ